MAWCTSSDVEVVVQADLSSDSYIDGLIDHVQALCEAIVGEQTEPVSNVLKAEFVQIVARFWQRGGKQASSNPAGFQSENVEDYGYTVPTGAHIDAGLGLTNREEKSLRRAVGLAPVWFITMDNDPAEFGDKFLDEDDLGLA